AVSRSAQRPSRFHLVFKSSSRRRPGSTDPFSRRLKNGSRPAPGRQFYAKERAGAKPDLCAKETECFRLAALAAMAGFRVGSRAVSGWDPRYESAVLADRHPDRHLHLAADRPGGFE